MPIDRICLACGAPFRTKPAYVAKGEGRFCSRRCGQVGRARAASPSDRFWAKVERTEGCWLWRGALIGTGYGDFIVTPESGGKTHILAHRFSYELAIGPIPPGMFICHHCDVRACVRPDHLFLGDAAANNRDTASKGRHWRQQRRR